MVKKRLHHLTCIQHLHRPDLCSLDKRRQQVDLTFAYGIFNGRDITPLITLLSRSHPRAHGLKLRHRCFHLAFRKGFFCVRVVESWNNLQTFVFNPSLMAIFRKGLGTRWDTIHSSDELFDMFYMVQCIFNDKYSLTLTSSCTSS